MQETSAAPRPYLVLVCGKPGAGKTTLAGRLAQRDALGFPLLCRDALKLGLVETHTTSETGAWRAVVETEALRATVVPSSYRVFYRTIRSWLNAGVSLIAEYGFSRGRCESDLRPLARLARTMIVQCDTSPEVARLRFAERERSDPHSRPDQIAVIVEQMQRGSFDWAQFDAPDLGVPILRVDTTSGYVPDLDAIVRFCRRGADDASATVVSPQRLTAGARPAPRPASARRAAR